MSYSVGVLLLLIILQTQDCLDCYACNNLQSVNDCHNVAICQADYVCSIVSNGTGDNILFNLGCRHKDQCPNLSQSTTVSPGPSIIGRDLTSDTCDTCCIDDGCNKRICPNYPDGGWSTWTTWSLCNVTCGNGTMTRIRKCDNPTPANGGLPCSGAINEEQQCSLSPCPVHGGWSAWSDWGSCSTSCGAGLQKKYRTCSNPPPSNSGDICFGDSTDSKACSEQLCNSTGQHVAFYVRYPSSTLYGNWGTPTFTTVITNVGDGYNETTGTFTCPVKGLYTFSFILTTTSNPNHHQTYCYLYQDEALGQTKLDKVHGGWSSWSGWDSCTTSCGAGLHKQTRTCSNPLPSRFGDHCFGSNTEYQGCYERACSVQHVLFSVNNPSSTLNGNAPIFRTTITNIGGGYNMTTGIFTCPVKGLYTFSMTIAATIRSSHHQIYCYLDYDDSHGHTNVNKGFVESNTGSGTNTQSTITVYLELSVGDKVHPSCTGWQYVYTDFRTMFNGALSSL